MNATAAPLAGLKILDFTVLLPGPFATQVLSDLGAEVLRIEAPDRPDLSRTMPPDVGGVSALHASLNRGKRSLALDLKAPESIAIVKRLIAEHDIVIEGFRPGVMQRLGLGYDTLGAINPALIYCALSGFGQTGPLRDRPGHDLGYLALAGALGHGGDAHRPALLGVQVGDLAGSLYAAIGILAAVAQRQRTGRGDFVDISIADAAFSLHALWSPGVLAGALAPRAQRHMLNGGGLYDVYQSRDGRWFAMGALEPPFLAALLEALGLDAGALASASTPEGLARLKERIVDAFAQRDYADWLAIFEQVEACVEPVLGPDEAIEHPQFVAREMVIEVPGPDGRPLSQPGCAIKFSRRLPGPAFCGVASGAHNDEILAAIEGRD